MYLLLWASTLIPLLRAWQANRQTTLRPALAWAAAAWACWVALASGDENGPLGRYLALSLTCCSGVAVLGSRRPGVAAWNGMVVAGLLAVLLLPVAQGLGTPRLHPAHLLFLAITLGVVHLNYLPTRLGPAAALFGLGCAVQLAQLAGATPPAFLTATAALAQAASPWLALLLLSGRTAADPFDRTWRAFRDRFGLLWSLRIRDQVNRAAANAGWALELGWTGQHRLPEPGTPSPDEALALLHAILKRFGPPPTD